MNIAAFSWSTHGSQIQEWFDGHGLGQVPVRTYPDEGYIVPDLAALWVYHSANAPMSFISYHIINPKQTALGLKALDELTDFAEAVSKAGGTQFIFQSLGSPALKQLAGLKNYVKGDTDMVHYWKEL